MSHCAGNGETCHDDDNGVIVLVGNPNVGKSVIFGALTGRYVTVSNYPGTTVELAEGRLPDGSVIVDTPGTNTLYGNSDDERVTRDILLSGERNLRAVVQVADAKNLRRALLLTSQLAELKLPVVLAINMVDEAAAHGIRLDSERLSRRLGIEVVPMVATRGEGLDRLLQSLQHARPLKRLDSYTPELESAIDRVEMLLPDDLPARRATAMRLLAGDTELAQRFSLNGALSDIQAEIATRTMRPVKSLLIEQQIGAAWRLADEVMTIHRHQREGIAWNLSRWAVHPVWGWPILIAVLFAVYKLVGEFGAGTLVDFMEGTVFGEWINPLATRIVDAALPIPFIHDLLVGDYGLITMALTYGLALVLPIVSLFFIAFSILEDSGYLPRLAVMLNRAFMVMGLNGKAVLPMVLGLGCDTMATLSTRMLETRKERLLTTLLLALGVPCSAQLGVILGMMSAVGPAGAVIWAGVIVATMLAVGLIAARLLPGDRSPFILELPPMRLPRISNILIKTAARVEWYLKEVLPLFAIGTLLLFALDRTGALVLAEQVASPIVVGLLGLPAAATGAFLIGFLRRDYGAAGLFAMSLAGELTAQQVLVSLIVITLFMPCIANLLLIVKEFGVRVAVNVAGIVFPLAFAVGGLVNALLRAFGVAF